MKLKTMTPKGELEIEVRVRGPVGEGKTTFISRLVHTYLLNHYTCELDPLIKDPEGAEIIGGKVTWDPTRGQKP